MSRRHAAAAGLCAALGLASAVYAVRVADHYRHARVDLAPVKAIALDDSTRRALAALDGEVLVVYYTSPRSQMPSSMRRLERDVVDLLRAMARASAGRFTYQIVDAAADPELAAYASRQRIAPFRVRSVARDSYSERTVWSSLTIAYGPRPQVVLNGIEPAHLPRLQSLIVGHLRQLERPRRPTVAVSSPAGFADLRQDLSRRATVIDVDLDAGDAIPPEADLLFWIEPERIDASRLRQIDRFLDRGRSLVIAGSALAATRGEADGEPAAVFDRARYGMEPLLAEYGLRPVRGLVLDQRSGHLELGTESVPAPFMIRSIAPNQSFQRLRGQPNGTLLFIAPTPLLPDPERLAERGWSAEILATTSEESRLLPEAPRALSLQRLGPELDALAGAPVSKQPLVVWLRPDDPWRGSIVALAGATPLHDHSYHDPGAAHGRLVDVLVATLASDERLVSGGATVPRGEPIRELSPSRRLLWRGVTVLLPAAVLAGIALARGVPRPHAAVEGRRSPGGFRRAASGLSGAALAWIAVTAITSAAPALPGRIDVSAGELSRLAPRTSELARGAIGEHAVDVEIVFSGDSHLPPEMRRHLRRLLDALVELRAAGADLSLRRVRPETLDAAARAALPGQGIEPIQITSRDEHVTVVRSIHASLRLRQRSGAAETVLAFPDALSFEHLEFRLAFALWRLRTGRDVLVALAPDSPRLSPAEAHEEYQQRGRMAPTGTDVYAVARAILEQNDFRVTHVSPPDPHLPDDADLLIWLQPRRRIDPMLEAATGFLRRGRPVLIAAQHFNLQARQYPGRGHSFVYWPQPQWPELEGMYLPDLGIHLVREVLFDDLATTIRHDAAIFRDAQRELREQHSALPFVVRASAANFSPESPITRGLGDQALVWGSYLRLDPAALAANGITARVVMTTSPRAWSYHWTGGFLPEEVLEGETAVEHPEARRLGRVPLAVELEGVFPLYVRPPDPEPPAEAAMAHPNGRTEEPGRPARLVLIGGSELFKNHRILDPDFRADHLLLNATAALALEPDLAAVVTRRAVARGFDYVEPERRLLWRAAVIAGFPLGLLVFAVGRIAWNAAAARSRSSGRTP
ncbi:MAG TPA: Gldg family protein [Thermoanaerobaculia bacterium]|nr:Gldg family protein [Thermoanaerobaculia bacterium]